MDAWLKPIELKGSIIDLVPLTEAHREQLLAAASNGKLWELWYTFVPSVSTIDQYLAQAMKQQRSGNALPFVVVNKADQKIIGSTRYLNAEPEHKRLEIGSTWYAKDFQRTGVNTECKYLLLKYAFEKLNAIAVEFRTSWHNHPSRSAILRLGAKQDGVLRNHRMVGDGAFRDTVVFSIIQLEWPMVKKSLEFKMNRYRN
jgi:RimJ/RimL family protein N-acetyltransferase